MEICRHMMSQVYITYKPDFKRVNDLVIQIYKDYFMEGLR